MLVGDDAVCLAVELLALLLEHFVAHAHVFFERLCVEVSIAARTRCQVQGARLHEGISTKVFSEAAPAVLESRDHLLGDIVLVAVEPRLLAWLVGISTAPSAAVILLSSPVLSTLLRLLLLRGLLIGVLAVVPRVIPIPITSSCVVGRLHLAGGGLPPLWLVLIFLLRWWLGVADVVRSGALT